MRNGCLVGYSHCNGISGITHTLNSYEIILMRGFIFSYFLKKENTSLTNSFQSESIPIFDYQIAKKKKKKTTSGCVSTSVATARTMHWRPSFLDSTFFCLFHILTSAQFLAQQSVIVTLPIPSLCWKIRWNWSSKPRKEPPSSQSRVQRFFQVFPFCLGAVIAEVISNSVPVLFQSFLP